MRQDFKAFLTKSNAIALALGVSIGAATGKAVSSLVDDLIMPVVSLLLPSGSWKGAKIVLKTFTDARGRLPKARFKMVVFSAPSSTS